jgi:predicted O-linked N-acetylglucosamine transferase (SPINDLY family)
MHSHAAPQQAESPAPSDPAEVLRAATEALIAGQGALAAELTGRLMAGHDSDPDVLYTRAAALLACGDEAGGLAGLERACGVQSLQAMQSSGVDLLRLINDPRYALAMGRRLYNAFQMGPAILALSAAVTDPETAASGAMFVMAQALHYQGRVEQAYDAFRNCYAMNPSASMGSFALYSLFFVKDGPRRQAEAAREWSRLWAEPLASARRSFPAPRHADRRLRIGYVGPSFSRNQARHFLVPLLDHHDPGQFEVFCYVEDEAQEIPREDVRFRSIKLASDDATADMIRADAIDVLVDCHGHCARGRPTVFARKPAPVQVSWLNYIHTTGMTAMDYVIHSDDMGADTRQFVEHVHEIGPILAPFRPDPAALTSPLPARSKGYLTFGCFNHPAKISDQTVAAWARVLKATPGSRLKLKYSCYADAVLRAETSTRFLAHGVAPSRLDYEGHTTGEAYEQAFAGIDIALDPSPCPGGTTTMDALSRGVPVLTLKGDDFYARVGVQSQLALGLPGQIAESWDDYVAKAAALAADLDALEALRAEIRPRLDASLYRDEVGFTRRMERAYREMFAPWLAHEAAA